jgi:hypothetical protein
MLKKAVQRNGSVRLCEARLWGPFATRSFANDPGCANLNPDDDSSPLKRRERSMTGAATDGEPHVLMEANVDEVCVGAAVEMARSRRCLCPSFPDERRP